MKPAHRRHRPSTCRAVRANNAYRSRLHRIPPPVLFSAGTTTIIVKMGHLLFEPAKSMPYNFSLFFSETDPRAVQKPMQKSKCTYSMVYRVFAQTIWPILLRIVAIPVLDRWKREDGRHVDRDILRHIGPAHFEGVNFRGTFDFPMRQYQ